jgi:hypothetical protein
MGKAIVLLLNEAFDMSWSDTRSTTSTRLDGIVTALTDYLLCHFSTVSGLSEIRPLEWRLLSDASTLWGRTLTQIFG